MANMMQALGMIETKGLVASIEAADAMVKAANVTYYTAPAGGPQALTYAPPGGILASYQGGVWMSV